MEGAWRVRVRHDAAGTTLSLPEGGATLLSRLKGLAVEALNVQVKRGNQQDEEKEEQEEEEEEREEEYDGLLVLRGYPLQEVNACPSATQTSENTAAANKVRELLELCVESLNLAMRASSMSSIQNDIDSLKESLGRERSDTSRYARAQECEKETERERGTQTS